MSTAAGPKQPRLIRRASVARVRTRWPDEVHQVLDEPRGFVRVLGGPGTGKTTLLAELAARRILDGIEPEQVLVVTANRRAATEVRSLITAMLTNRSEPAEVPRTIREPLVRTVHSYAFAVLRLQSQINDAPGPKLLPSAEQDAVIRELLAGDVEDGAGRWPERLRAALPVAGFAEELRDLLLRAAERGLGPEDLIRLGRKAKRDEWVAAGRFGVVYEQVTLLQGAAASGHAQESSPALDAAELVASADLAFDIDLPLLLSERARVRHLLVDDAQHLDPLQYRLLRQLGDAADEFVLAGDPDQAVFSFRGADPTLLRDAEEDGAVTLTLHAGHRMSNTVRTAVASLAERLPGVRHTLARRAQDEEVEDGSVTVRLHTSAAAEAAWVADQLRRAHLLDGVPWSDMAVLVRSAARSVPVLHRALAAAGVPVASAEPVLPLAQQGAVRPLLLLLRCAAVPAALNTVTAIALLTSPLGGADPLSLRRLRRALRRIDLAAGGDRPSDELVVEVIESQDRLAALEDAESRPVRRLAALLATARAGVEAGVSIEQVLWDVWQQSGWEPRLVAQAGRGGPVGAQADRDLDAVVALFHAAERYSDRLPGSTVVGFVEHLSAHRIVGDTLAPSAPQGDAVAVLTAHASAGREWTVVAVPGVQEGSWPDLRLRGSLLGVEQMVDTLAGLDTSQVLSATAPLLAEERRLLLVAVSRARRTLLVSAVQGEDEQPSRFLAELLDTDPADLSDLVVPLAERSRALVLPDLVGELREVVCDVTVEPARRGAAARQLARLAEASVPGAHPSSWYGLPQLSTMDALRDPDATVNISPSTVDVLARCPLRWMVERHGGADPAQLAAITGTLVHALAQAAASGATQEQLREELTTAWAAVDAGAPWFSRRERLRVQGMVDTFMSWLAASRSGLTQVAVERDVTIVLPVVDGPKVRLRGRVDRLESDVDGRPVVVDIKTGKMPMSEKDAREHPQLAVYQLAAAFGAFTDLGLDAQPGGARLLYVAKANRKTGATERNQDPVDGDAVAHWLGVVRDAASATMGPDYQAKENPDCPRCPVRTSCPLHPSGRQVTE